MELNVRQEIRDFLLNRVKSCRVLVVGDVMLDRYFYGEVTRISPEAPVPVDRISNRKDTLGGAASVAHNLAQIGCHVLLAGVIGDDHHGRLLKRKLEKRAIATSGIFFGRESTTTKIRVIGNHQQIVRMDFEETDKISQNAEENLLEYAHKQCQEGMQAVILSDYGKGVCTETLCQSLIKIAQEYCVPIFIDPKGNAWKKYKNANYITPNVKETADALGRNVPNVDEALRKAAHDIQRQFDIYNVIITRSERGMSIFSQNEGEVHVPTVAQEVFDVSGAGDTVIATLAVGIGGGLSLQTATQMANFAAGIEVSKMGTYAVSAIEILERL